MKAHLEEGRLARSYETEDEDEREFIGTLNLLTWKPVIFAANVAEGDLANDALTTATYSPYAVLLPKMDVRYLSSVLRLSRKSQSWMRMRRKCS